MRIAKYDLEGNFLEEFEGKSLVDLSEKIKIDYDKLYMCVTGRQFHYKSFQYKEVNAKIRAFKKIAPVWDLNQGVNRGVPIGKYYKGIFICSYDNPSEAAVKNDLNVSNLVQNCKGNLNSCGDFVFKYMNKKI